MGFKTFTCEICGKTDLSKRQTYALPTGRICREHYEEEVKPSEHKNMSVAVYDIPVDPRCPEIGWVKRIIFIVKNGYDNPNVAENLIERIFGEMDIKGKKPENVAFMKAVSSTLFGIDMRNQQGDIIHAQMMMEKALSQYEKMALPTEESCREHIVNTLIPYYVGFVKEFHTERKKLPATTGDEQLPAFDKLAEIFNQHIDVKILEMLFPVRLSPAYNPKMNTLHKLVYDLGVAAGEFIIGVNTTKSHSNYVVNYINSIVNSITLYSKHSYEKKD